MGQPDSVVYGKWQLFQSENFEEFMSRLGVSYLVRKLGNKSTPVVTVSKDENDVMSFKQESLVSTTEIKCKIGEPFDEKTADGREVRNTYFFSFSCKSQAERLEFFNDFSFFAITYNIHTL